MQDSTVKLNKNFATNHKTYKFLPYKTKLYINLAVSEDNWKHREILQNALGRLLEA